MERIKRRKLKFLCLFGGREEHPRRKNDQSWSPDNVTTEQSLFKFEVGKSTFKERNEKKIKNFSANRISNASSAKKRSPCILVKLMCQCKYVEDAREPINIGHIANEIFHVSTSVSFNEYEVIAAVPRITVDHNDRITHSLSNFSEQCLITEAKSRISERWKMTISDDDVEIVGKGSTLRELLSFPDSDEGLTLTNGGTDGQKDECLLSTYKSTSSHETDYRMDVGDGVDAREHGSEDCEQLKEVVHSSRYSLLEAPSSEDASSDYVCFERLDSRIRELKKQLHLLNAESTLTSNTLTLTPKVKRPSQESVKWKSSFMAQILQASGIYDIDPDTFTPPYQTAHHPIDPMLFYRVEKYYFEGSILSRSEKRLVHDYIEQTFIRISKSMVAHPWVNPEKRESQLTLKKFNIDDQMCKVIYEIDKEDDEIYFAINYDKDPEWAHPVNEIDILGKQIGELILSDLVLEFINF